MKKWLIGAATAALVIVYQNCAFKSARGGADLYSQGCTAILKQAYLTTYYNAWFRSGDSNHNCIPCHAGGGEAGPSREFANADPEKAFEVFSTIGRSRVENNGINSGHKPPHTGPQNQSYLNSASSVWSSAEAAADKCNGSTEVKVAEVAPPTNVYTATFADNVVWPKITWDLDSGVTGKPNVYHMTVTMEVRRFMDNTKTPPAAIGYQFRNPTVAVKTVNGTTPVYRIEKLTMTINGGNYTYMTAYDLLDVTVNSTAGVNVAQGAAIAAAPTDSLNVSNTDTFGLHFAAILNGDGSAVSGSGPASGGGGPNLPARVSFADLQGTNAQLNVFVRACNSCHKPGNAQGSLDLTNYAMAAQLATTCKSRMNNAANPMPPAGLLSNSDRTVIDIWISSGTPQN
jgi:hypothetical protein